jgi:RimJ/RimL family protein N-acetyltransferase
MFPEFTRDEVFMIGTQRLWLRWPRSSDAAALATIGGTAAVAAMTATWPIGATESYARRRIASMRAENEAGLGFAFVMAERGRWNEAIGVIGFRVLDGSGGAVAGGGYHLAPEHWGKGYASEAMTGLISNLRLLTRIARLTASVMPQNHASAAVLKKNGFILTGAGTLTNEHRGTFKVDHYARDLRLIGPPALPVQGPAAETRVGAATEIAERCVS